MLLAAAPPAPRWLLVIPILWSFVGGSAAIVLGVTPDLLLFAAGASMVGYVLSRRGPRERAVHARVSIR
jgi:hypothetical protein